MANLDSMERIWFDKRKFEEAERKFAEHVANEHASLVVEVNVYSSTHTNQVSLVNQGVGLQIDSVPSDNASPPSASSSSVKVSVCVYCKVNYLLQITHW